MTYLFDVIGILKYHIAHNHYIGFYRNFIDGFGNISHPLNKLTSENVPFVWSQECELAFEDLKSRLAAKPVLAFSCLGKEFVVNVISNLSNLRCCL